MLKRLWATMRKGRLERELDDEIRFHLETLEEEFVAKGMNRDEARLAARREFGAVEPMKEAYRERRGAAWVESLWQDVRYGLRVLRRSPGFTAAAVVTLALGIGANTAVFSLVRAVLLKMQPVERPEEIVALSKTGGYHVRKFSYPFYQELEGRKDVLAGLAASGGWQRARVRMDGESGSEQRFVERVSGTYFATLGVRARLGRLLEPKDETSAVISEELWRTRFGEDARVLGKKITVDQRVLTVAGVAQRGFRGLEPQAPIDVWTPILMDAQWKKFTTSSWLVLLARLREGVSAEQLREAVEVAHRSYMEEALRGQNHPWKADLLGSRVVVRPGAAGSPRLREQFDRPLVFLMGLVGLVLVVSCANVANLLLARGLARWRELSVRLAIGASRSRLVRQMVTESCLLAVMGAAAGLVLAVVGSEVLVRFLPYQGAGTVGLDVTPDGAVLGFTVAAAAAAVLFGVFPALRSLRPVRRGGQGSRRALVAAQVALSIVVVAAALLFSRSLAELRGVDAGFDRDGVFTFALELPAEYTRPQAAAVYERVLERLQRVAGVAAASHAAPGPFREGKGSRTLLVRGERGETPQGVDVQEVTPNYHAVLGAPLLAGRGLQERDRVRPVRSAVVNEAFVRRFLQGLGEPVGRRVGMGREADGGPFFSIVGVVKDIRHQALREAAVPMVYMPARRDEAFNSVPFQVRGTMKPEDVRAAIAEVDGQATMGEQWWLRQWVEDSLSQERLLAAVSGMFAVLALVVAAVGLYGVMAYGVARRTREIGIRMAIGARRGEVVWMVVRDGLAAVGLGVATGLPAAMVASRLAGSLLYGVKPGDAVSLGAAVGLLAGAGAAAAFAPARRAAGIEPREALRHE
ncbi:MAG: ABC transporter permease [Bryobacteraceae bacterium]|nr:ABC transporter permease [Bryobacteraceae bacterium]